MVIRSLAAAMTGIGHDANAHTSIVLRLICIVVAGLVSVSAAQSLHGQMTTAQLIGRAVENPDDPRFKDVERAIAQFFQGDVAAAKKLLSLTREQNAQLPPADVMFARLCFAAGEAVVGRAALEDAVSLQPDDPESYLLLGEIAFREGRLAESELLLGRGRERCDHLADQAFRQRNLKTAALAGMAAIHESRGKWSEVEEVIRDWLAVEKTSAEAKTRLGRCLFHQAKYQSAYSVFQELFKADPSSPQPEIQMGLLYEELVARGDTKKHHSARQAMEIAAKNDPDRLATRLAVARWGLATCEIEIAKTNAAVALKIDPKSFEALFLTGLVARHHNDHAAAESSFEIAHLRSPANFAVINQLALALIEQKDQEKTRRALEYAQLNAQANSDRSQPGGREAAVTLAWIMFRAGRRAEAVRTVQAALAAGDVSGESAFFAASIFSGVGANDAARSLLQEALESRCFPARRDAEALARRLEEAK